MMRNYGIVIATLLFSFSATATTYRTDSFGTTRDDKGNSWRTDSFGTTRGSNGSVSRTDSFGTTRVTNANGENTTYRTDSFGTTRGSDGTVSQWFYLRSRYLWQLRLRIHRHLPHSVLITFTRANMKPQPATTLRAVKPCLSPVAI